MPIRIVQIQRGDQRRVAIVREPELGLTEFASVYELVSASLDSGATLLELLEAASNTESIGYESIYRGDSDWRLLPPIDHPEPARCMVSGTGLTHGGSARDRQSMHVDKPEQITDSMRMYRSGVEGGRPAEGAVGTAPEWFYKGTGSILRAHREPLTVPWFGEDGGEEAEIAGIYIIGPDAVPRRVGMAMGNEFSDHKYEKKNYLHLAGSKIRTCSLGPELVIGAEFQSVPGTVSIRRDDMMIWSKQIATGEAEMCHSLANIEHHHFKYDGHRRPGDVHVHYYGAHSLSFGDGIELRSGDIMQVRFDGFGRPLHNPLDVSRVAANPVVTIPL
ncbi:MAG: GguC protein [Burkholderiales bacterium]|nr:GguC protein [Phycisphaerae bacterium]